MTSQKKPLEPNLLDKREKLANKLAGIDDEIFDRIGFILNTIYDTFEKTLFNWYFYGASEGSVGDFGSNHNEDEVSGFVLDPPAVGRGWEIILDDGTEWTLNHGIFPTRWLYEDFEKELIEGKKKFEEKRKSRR